MRLDDAPIETVADDWEGGGNLASLHLSLLRLFPIFLPNPCKVSSLEPVQHSNKEGRDPSEESDRRKVDHLPEDETEGQNNRHEDALDEGDEQKEKMVSKLSKD